MLYILIHLLQSKNFYYHPFWITNKPKKPAFVFLTLVSDVNLNFCSNRPLFWTDCMSIACNWSIQYMNAYEIVCWNKPNIFYNMFSLFLLSSALCTTWSDLQEGTRLGEHKFTLGKCEVSRAKDPYNSLLSQSLIYLTLFAFK